MPRPDDATLFAALGDPVRLSLLRRLVSGDGLTLAALTADTSITRQGTAKHMAVLEAAGLVISDNVGRERRVRLAPGGLAEARRALARIEAGLPDA